MRSPEGCLARLMEVSGVAPDEAAYDWAEIEASLDGLVLPDDYKDFVERFPDGRFRGLVRVIRPGDVGSPRTEFLGFYANWLDDMRRWRASGDGVFPHPIYPEKGGLLPWAEGPGGEMCFWLTDGDPQDWTIVTADRNFLDWQTFGGPMCLFLLDLASGDMPHPFDSTAPVPLTQDIFEPFETLPTTNAAQAVAPQPARPSPAASGKPWRGRSPIDESAELLRLVTAPAPTETVDWFGLQTMLGTALPPDYRAFVDRLGLGTFCDIGILGPDSCGELDLVGVRQRETRLDGLLPWGLTADGWICGWRTHGSRSDGWSVVMVSPHNDLVFHDELSFSSFLLRYCGAGDQLGIFHGRQPWMAGPTFTPHLH
jgi:hypothetical protein